MLREITDTALRHAARNALSDDAFARLLKQATDIVDTARGAFAAPDGRRINRLLKPPEVFWAPDPDPKARMRANRPPHVDVAALERATETFLDLPFRSLEVGKLLAAELFAAAMYRYGITYYETMRELGLMASRHKTRWRLDFKESFPTFIKLFILVSSPFVLHFSAWFLGIVAINNMRFLVILYLIIGIVVCFYFLLLHEPARRQTDERRKLGLETINMMEALYPRHFGPAFQTPEEAEILWSNMEYYGVEWPIPLVNLVFDMIEREQEYE